MSDKPNSGKPKPKVSRAEIKAYESRRAEERRRLMNAAAQPEPSAEHAQAYARSIEITYEMTRDEEFAVIRGDLIRLLMIVAVLFVVLAGLTVWLR
jgi:cobalamin biosynthesis Mg chelatase CobN